jgi:hypothetical protein
LFEEDRRVAEGKLRLAARGGQGGGQLTRLANHPNAPATTAGGSLKHDGVTELRGVGGRILRVDDRPAAPRHDGDIHLLREPFGRNLLAEHAHAGAVWPGEDNALLLAPLRERRLLGEEAPADPGHVGLGHAQRGDDPLLVEIG